MTEAAIHANLSEVEDRIGEACTRVGRSRSEITLVAVSKTFPRAVVETALAAGIRDIGENKVQEADGKVRGLGPDCRLHMIGHLQSNKARLAAEIFDVVQTVDSERIARRLDRAANELGKRLDVLIQVNVGGEEQKAGVDPGEVHGLAERVLDLEHLRLVGLMTIPPLGDESESRRYFSRLRELLETLRARTGMETLRELSMGMSGDYAVAIEEGATIVRVGSAIFGSRNA